MASSLGLQSLAPMAKSGAASAVFIMDVKGRVLIWRDYRGDVSATQAERFFNKLMDQQASKKLCCSIACLLPLFHAALIDAMI